MLITDCTLQRAGSGPTPVEYSVVTVSRVGVVNGNLWEWDITCIPIEKFPVSTVTSFSKQIKTHRTTSLPWRLWITELVTVNPIDCCHTTWQWKWRLEGDCRWVVVYKIYNYWNIQQSYLWRMGRIGRFSDEQKFPFLASLDSFLIDCRITNPIMNVSIPPPQKWWWGLQMELNLHSWVLCRQAG